MIYICIPTFDEAPTVGLLLWKIRRVFGDFAREYQLLVVDDASTDATAELLESYTKVLPLTVLRHTERRGYAASVEELLRLAVERTDRPKRDCAVLIPADFAYSPEFIPELIKRIESGSDLVIGEATLTGEVVRGRRLLRRWAPALFRGIRVPGVRDVVSGIAAFRLVSLKNALRVKEGRFLSAEGWAANAELYAKTAQHARRIDAIPVTQRADIRPRASRQEAWDTAKYLWREGRRLKFAPPKLSTEPPPPRGGSGASSLEAATQ
ncbi:MAG: glycosyltransferase family 2 protein [Gemmatimonadota bacterium]